MATFCGLAIKTDIYKGVHIDLEASENDSNVDELEFEKALKDSLKTWIAEENRCVWVRVPIKQTQYIPILAKLGFNFHHAKKNFAMLFKWIKDNEEIKAPSYAHSMVGVGGLVYNPTTKKVLLVQEKTSVVKIWKFPGGYVEEGEDIFETAIREVKEETGLTCKFQSLLTFRHRKKGAYGCSDFYYVCLLQPENSEIENLKKCELEIAEAEWFDLKDAYEKLGGFNKFVFTKFLEQYENLPFQLDSKSTCKGNTIISEMIHSQYAHLNFNERVYSIGPANTFH